MEKPKRPARAAIEIQSAENLDMAAEFTKAYVLGNYGTGKSVFGSTFPTPGYVFDFDQGIKIYRGKQWDYNTIPLTWKGWTEFEQIVRQVKKKVEDGTYKSVIVDSTTAMTDCAMGRALQIDPKRSAEGGPIWNVHYMIVRNLMEPKLREILSWPCNVLFTGHWNIVMDPETGNIISIDPLLTGQMSAKVPGYFDEVYAAFTGKKAGKEMYYLRTSAWGHYRSRSRTSGPLRLLPDKIDNDYPTLITHIKEAQRKEKELKEQAKAQATETN